MIIISVILFILTAYIYHFYNKVKKLPPGPLPLLFLGNIPQLMYGSYLHGGMVETLRRYAKQYGKTFTLWIGPMPTIHLCDYPTAVEVMVRQGAKQVGRWAPYTFTTARRDKNDVLRGTVASEGEIWSDHRRFSLRTLRNFGLGRNLMENTIMEEFSFHCAHLDSQMKNGTANISTHEFIDMLVGSVINRMLFGYRFDEKNKDRFFRVKATLDEMLENTTPIDLLLGTWCKGLPILGKRYNILQDAQVKVFDFIWENIERRKNDHKCGDRILEGEGEDFLDAYFIEMKKRDTETADNFFDEFGLAVDLFDLWLAGQETTSTTLSWGFTYLLLHPEVTRKCREEIFNVTKKNRNISLTDRSETPYLLATITEIQRLASILNLPPLRRSTESTQIGDLIIPPNSAIVASLSVILSDESVFKDPSKFNPNRYLSEEGKTCEQRVIPFGIGKRACLGESLARAELYLIIANFLHRYDFSIDVAHPPSMDPHSLHEAIHRPNDFKMNVTYVP